MSSVLIVDDEGGMRKILARWLSAQGYDIRVAADAEMALEEIGKAVPDVVMCDVEMPGHGGLWLAAQIGERFPATAIVLATALDAVPPVNSLKPSVVAYLVKPFARDLVVQAVSRAVAWRGVQLASPPWPAASGDRLAQWLKSIDD